jgi:two-component system, OmpR family, sensor histidine kinase KdpD
MFLAVVWQARGEDYAVTIGSMSSSSREFKLAQRGGGHSRIVGAGTAMLRQLALGNPGVVAQHDPACSFLDRARHVIKINAVSTFWSLALVALVTLGYFGIHHAGFFNFVPVVYLVPVVIAATRWGTVPAIIASVAGFLVSDYYFYPPYYSFLIEDPQEVMDLLLFLFVALVTSNLASHLRREANALHQSQKELHDLYDFSRRLAGCSTVSDLMIATQSLLSRALSRSVHLIGASGDCEVESPNAPAVPAGIKQEATAMIAEGEHATRTIFDDSTCSVWLIRLLSSETTCHGALAIDLGTGTRDAVESMRRRVDGILADAMTTLERLNLAHAMDEGKLRRQSDMLKDALIASVSHELRTPLTSILGSASVLEATPEVRQNARTHSLVESIYDEAKQLDNDIQNLLDATRIAGSGVQPRREWVDPADIVNAAVNKRDRRLAKHRLELQLGRDLPLVKVDSALIEQAFGQFLENAVKYSPTGSTVTVAAAAEPDHIVLSVSDQGVGLTPDETASLGRRAFRGRRHLGRLPGSGLGLWIANTFVAANGGTIDAVSRGSGLGTTMSIRLPASKESASAVMAATDG